MHTLPSVSASHVCTLCTEQVEVRGLLPSQHVYACAQENEALTNNTCRVVEQGNPVLLSKRKAL